MNDGSLPVPGAELYYKVQGSGPLLLILQGGDGDADTADAMVRHLAHRFTVVTYDRRGLSRSTVRDLATPVEVGTHSDDAAHLLGSLSNEPTLVFGTSLGAVVGLDLISRHSDQVALLIAHEPPATELLATSERETAIAAQLEVDKLLADKGLGPAWQRFLNLIGVDREERELGVELALPTPRRIANINFFLTHDVPAVRRYRLDLAAVYRSAERVVPAAGRASRDTFPRRCAEALAIDLDRRLVELAGGHAGFILRPRAFAAELCELLDSLTPPSPTR